MPISSRSLIRLCYRVGTAVKAGLPARRIWELEEQHSSGQLREAMTAIREHVDSGKTIAEGMQATPGYFPMLLIEMVSIGEQTGKLDEIFRRLGDHYEHLATMRRNFWTGIAWPLFELGVAVMVIGFLIFIMGMISSFTGGEAQDVLGWGLVGTRGAIIWFVLCGLVAALVALAANALFRGWLGPTPVLIAMRIPVLGKCLESLALSRLTWSLSLALDSGMDAYRAANLALRACQNPYYESSQRRVAAGIRANRQFYESFGDGQVFPVEFLQQLQIAEDSGTTTESLLRLASEYEERARDAMRLLTGIATAVVMFLIFGVIIFAVISIAWHGYMKHLYDALEMTNTGRI